MCGEQGRESLDTRDAGGSSPRVRGTDIPKGISPGFQRFIPACAGNRGGTTQLAFQDTVHPRVCGEQKTTRCDIVELLGSSPRVRGTGVSAMQTESVSRFIPACAGNSFFRFAIIRPLPVHPRVCGEQLPDGSRVDHPNGSSPRVRGTGSCFLQFDVTNRFIPACAGNSPWLGRYPQVPTVHPRVCGEQERSEIYSHPCRGSSPRVRGTDRQPPEESNHVRFIPACAGNRGSWATPDNGLPVHPRVCGEQCTHHNRWTARPGSSPRVRGTAS